MKTNKASTIEVSMRLLGLIDELFSTSHELSSAAKLVRLRK